MTYEEEERERYEGEEIDLSDLNVAYREAVLPDELIPCTVDELIIMSLRE